jgi:hypothetical protein
MSHIYDQPCPVSKDTVEEFRQVADRHLGESHGGGMLPVGRITFDRSDSREFFRPHTGPRLEPIKIRVSRAPSEPRRIVVNKTTHRIRFENETENEVTVVIEPKGLADLGSKAQTYA